MSRKVNTFGEAIGVLVQAAHIAQKAGAFTLEDAALVQQSIEKIEELNQPRGVSSPDETQDVLSERKDHSDR